MALCSTLNLQLSNSQLNKSKSGIKNGTKVTLKLSSNVVGDSNDENNFPHKLLLTNTRVSKRLKAFAINSSANIIHKIVLLIKLVPLLKTGLGLMKNALEPLAKKSFNTISINSGSIRNRCSCS